MTNVNKSLGQIIAKYRVIAQISQEELAKRAGIHRTYVSQLERGLKSPTLPILFDIAHSLNIQASFLVVELENSLSNLSTNMTYIFNKKFNINCGFQVNSSHIKTALNQTNDFLETIPSTVYRSIDYKTTSSIIGSMFCQSIANITGAIVNPIEKGHPDVIPLTGQNSSEELLRNYPEGLEVKCTVGNIKTGENLRAGETRVNFLTGITWQAHHQEVGKLLGIVWDFVSSSRDFNYPKVTAMFYANNLVTEDWGQISGTSGRNTKVTGMLSSGKTKMGQGWVALFNNRNYIETYQKIMKFTLEELN